MERPARYRAIVEYDGSAYFGFQRQRAGTPSIQGTIEEVLAGLAGQPVTVTGAGRTDTGVHATGQVIGFTIDWPEKHGIAALQRAINANLPADIAILALSPATPDFHPRYDARWRTYEYCICNAPARRPLSRQRAWFVSRELDVARMNQAAALLVGEHDFATFGQPPAGDNTVREVREAQWRRESEWLTFRITANAFLYRMVRGLVGSLKRVGTGSWTVTEFGQALDARDRRRCATVAPAHGLCLANVDYDDDQSGGGV